MPMSSVSVLGSCRRFAFGVLGASLLLIAPTAVLAQSISGATADTTGSSADESGSTFFRKSAVVITTNTATALSTHFTWNLSADETSPNARNENGTAVHNISFSVTAPGAYFLTVNTRRRGDMNRVSDNAGCAGSADITNVAGSQTGGTLTSGSLNLIDPGAVNSGTGNAELGFNQTGSTVRIDGVSNGVAKPHTLSFTWTGTTRSNDCEAAVRLGESATSIPSFTAGTYPGSPGRTQANDGHFVDITLTSLCGNGTVDSGQGEQCDEGVNNGTPGSCCTSTCQFRAGGEECRASAGECDPNEVCTGASATCPADARTPANTPCTDDGNACTTDLCDGTSVDCQHDPGNAGATCRASAGECDPAETCTGASSVCPSDARTPANTPCTDDGNACTTDLCDGTSVDCQHDPGNSGATCRAAAGECDLAETCTGVSSTCPTDAKVPSGTTCTSDGNPCTVDECDGV